MACLNVLTVLHLLMSCSTMEHHLMWSCTLLFARILNPPSRYEGIQKTPVAQGRYVYAV